MKEPANFFTHFINGHEMSSYTFEPGDTPYYVAFRGKAHFALSLMIWANSEQHVREILYGAVQHRRECNRKYMTSDSARIEKRPTTYAELEKVLSGGESEYTLTINKFDPKYAVKVDWSL